MSPEAVVVDTDVASYLFKRDTRAGLYRPHLLGKLPVLSFMSLAELYKWAELRRWSDGSRRRMEQHLNNFVVYGYQRELCRVWARVMAEAEKRGRRLECADGWIAATAISHGIPLLTHNRQHFEGVEGLYVISEASQRPEPLP